MASLDDISVLMRGMPDVSDKNQFSNDVLMPHDIVLTLHPNNYFTLTLLYTYIPPFHTI